MIVLPDSLRRRHVYVIGKTQTGKSTLLLNLLRQDLSKGKGVCFIDPHGDAAELALRLIPRERVEEAIYFEPTQYPIALQSLATKSDSETELLCDDLITIFRRLSQSWGERMDALFRYGFHTLVRTPGSTLLDLYHLFTNDLYRADVLGRLTEPILVRFWTEEYPRLPKDSATPILLRLSKFVMSTTLRRIFDNRDAVDLAELMDRRRILIVNLARVGPDVRSILGTMLVSMIQIAVMRRAHRPRRERVPFYLYVDEFQHFASDSFETILSESGKFGLRLTLAHQFISQIDTHTRNAILGNVGTLVAFQLGIEDGEVIDRLTGYRRGRDQHWVGASGSRTLHIADEGYSTLALPKYQAVVKAGRRVVLLRTRPLRAPRDDCSALVRARMERLVPDVPAARVVRDPAPADFEVSPSPPPGKA